MFCMQMFPITLWIQQGVIYTWKEQLLNAFKALFECFQLSSPRWLFLTKLIHILYCMVYQPTYCRNVKSVSRNKPTRTSLINKALFISDVEGWEGVGRPAHPIMSGRAFWIGLHLHIVSSPFVHYKEFLHPKLVLKYTTHAFITFILLN